jgi:hypothetical protein
MESTISEPTQLPAPIDLPRIYGQIRKIDVTRDLMTKYIEIIELLQYFLTIPNLTTECPALVNYVRRKLGHIDGLANQLVEKGLLDFDDVAAGLQVVTKFMDLTAPTKKDIDEAKETKEIKEQSDDAVTFDSKFVAELLDNIDVTQDLHLRYEILGTLVEYVSARKHLINDYPDVSYLIREKLNTVGDVISKLILEGQVSIENAKIANQMTVELLEVMK